MGIVEVTRSGARNAEQRLVVQVTIASEGTLLRGEQSGSDLHAAIDAVADVLDRQIGRFKGKLQRRDRTSIGRAITAAEEGAAPAAEPEVESGKLVRTKMFHVESMTPEDATDQMELLGHDFFVFLNTTTDRLGVVYRRRDGDYGLLDPQLR